MCENKNCFRAGVDLPSSEFNKNRKTCKYCDRKRAKDFREKKYKKYRTAINRYLGKKCIICGVKKEKYLRCHEIYGQQHTNLLDTPLLVVKSNCKNGRFARVCAMCHGKAHSLIEKGITDWNVIQVYIKGFLRTAPPIENDAHLHAWHKYMRDYVKDEQLKLFDDDKYKKPEPPPKPYVYRVAKMIAGELASDDPKDKPVFVYLEPDELEDEYDPPEPYIFMTE